MNILASIELFHGPTWPLRILPCSYLETFTNYKSKGLGNRSAFFGATSGDTGAAAISGLLGVRVKKFLSFTPDGKVSPLQERQNDLYRAENIYPIAIEGTFDDAQRTVKELFGDITFRESIGLSAVNSINLARILAQSVYYLYAWLRLSSDVREHTTFVVPTGNFGNVFAGWLLTKMGIQFGGFRVATNQNDITACFGSGEYQLGEVFRACPSMDIQVASNLNDSFFISWMVMLKESGEVMTTFRGYGDMNLKNSPFQDFPVHRPMM